MIEIPSPQPSKQSVASVLNIRPIIYIAGMLLCALAAGMAVPTWIDLRADNVDWRNFAKAMALTFFFGGMMVFSTSSERHTQTINRRQGFVMIVFVWVLLSLFGALPFWMTGQFSLTDALFESVSGLTTTGATVINNLDGQAPGILIWRAILQWLGGVGIVLVAMSLLPFLRIGGMQIFESEMSEGEKALPRAKRLAGVIATIYAVLTLLCCGLYWMGGMSLFDAAAHAMSTISTGGFSTHDESFGYFQSLPLSLIAVVFMIAGGLPFVLYMKAVNGAPAALWQDTQVRCFFGILAAAIIVITAYLFFTQGMMPDSALPQVTFNIVSVMTGTGFANADYTGWGPFPVSIFFFIMFIGACAGSTTCGIKVFRFQILYAIATVQLKRLLNPHGVFVPHYNRRPVPEDVPAAVMGFFFVFALTFVVVALALSCTGLDFITALSAAATTVSNVGPGLGETIGPAGNFNAMPLSAKWIMMAAMLIGRLEILTVLVLFTPQFWRK